MNAREAQGLIPEVLDIEKAFRLISCAAKQGRKEITIKTVGEVKAALPNLGYSFSYIGWINDTEVIITIRWLV